MTDENINALTEEHDTGELYYHDHGDGHVHAHTHTHEHGHGHTHTQTKAVVNRLARAIGHLESVKRMVEENRYCGDVLTQLAAAEAAVHRVSEMVLSNHLETCVVEKIQKGDTEVIEEVMGLIRKFS